MFLLKFNIFNSDKPDKAEQNASLLTFGRQRSEEVYSLRDNSSNFGSLFNIRGIIFHIVIGQTSNFSVVKLGKVTNAELSTVPWRL